MYFPELFHTDLYQLTMGQSYFNTGKKDEIGTFEMFFRRLPFNGGYAVFCGRNSIYHFIENIENSLREFVLHFGSESKFISYFKKNFYFSEQYIQYLLKDLIHDIRSLDINTVEEGEIVFDNTPMVQVTGKMLALQVIETPLLQIVNSQTIVATKSARIKYVAGNRLVSDFGLRRSHNPQLTYAAIVGGCDSTSNIQVGAELGVRVAGTMAHSFVMTYGTTHEAELAAFREYARTFPENYTFLVDTYNIEKGIENAIIAAQERQGVGFNGIRIDSGDLCYWSVKARKMMNEAGFKKAKVVVSNNIDEYVIESLDNQAYRDYGLKNAPIDTFGVGTRLITAYDQPALGAVYKLVEMDTPRKDYVIKVSANQEKTTIPGKKALYRYLNCNGEFVLDFQCLCDEPVTGKQFRVIHKDFSEKTLDIDTTKGQIIPLLKPLGCTPLSEIHVQDNLKQLPLWHKRLQFPHIYKVSLSEKLFNLRQKLIKSAVSE